MDPELRAVGVGLAQLAPPPCLSLFSGLSWHLASEEPQSISYGELDAFLVALQLTRGPLIYFADDAKIEVGFARRVWEHSDLQN